MDMQESIKKALEAQAKADAEIAARKEKEGKNKDNKYLIKASEIEIKVEEFLTNFKDVYEVEELIENEYYSFKIKNDDKKRTYSLISDAFEDYSEAIIKAKKKDMPILELSMNVIDSYISEFHPHHRKESLKENVEKSKNWDERKAKEQQEFYSLDEDKVKEKLSNFVNQVYDLNISESKRFVDLTYNAAVKGLETSGIIVGDYYLNAEDIKPKLKEEIQEGEENILEKIKLMDKSRKTRDEIHEISNISNENKRKYFKIESKLKANVLKEIGKKTLPMRHLKEWEEAYMGGNEEIEKRLDKELMNKIKECEIPNAETVSGFPTFGFFNYYNISEREYCTVYPLVREISNIALAHEIAKNKVEVSSKIEKAIQIRVEDPDSKISFNVLEENKETKKQRNRLKP